MSDTKTLHEQLLDAIHSDYEDFLDTCDLYSPRDFIRDMLYEAHVKSVLFDFFTAGAFHPSEKWCKIALQYGYEPHPENQEFHLLDRMYQDYLSTDCYTILESYDDMYDFVGMVIDDYYDDKEGYDDGNQD